MFLSVILHLPLIFVQCKRCNSCRLFKYGTHMLHGYIWMKLELCLIHQLFGPSYMEAIQYIEVFCLLGRYSRCISLTVRLTQFSFNAAQRIEMQRSILFIIVHLIVIEKLASFSNFQHCIISCFMHSCIFCLIF